MLRVGSKVTLTDIRRKGSCGAGNNKSVRCNTTHRISVTHIEEETSHNTIKLKEQYNIVCNHRHLPVIFLRALDISRACKPICWSVMSPSNSARGTRAVKCVRQ